MAAFDILAIQAIDVGRLVCDTLTIAVEVRPSVPRTRMMAAWQEACQILSNVVKVTEEVTAAPFESPLPIPSASGNVANPEETSVHWLGRKLSKKKGDKRHG